MDTAIRKHKAVYYSNEEFQHKKVGTKIVREEALWSRYKKQQRIPVVHFAKKNSQRINTSQENKLQKIYMRNSGLETEWNRFYSYFKFRQR